MNQSVQTVEPCSDTRTRRIQPSAIIDLPNSFGKYIKENSRGENEVLFCYDPRKNMLTLHPLVDETDDHVFIAAALATENPHKGFAVVRWSEFLSYYSMGLGYLAFERAAHYFGPHSA